jgi:hypothetical protein
MKRHSITPPEIAKEGICPFCGGRFNGWGNDPTPLVGGPCCDRCVTALITPVRWQLLRHQLKAIAHPRGQIRPQHRRKVRS